MKGGIVAQSFAEGAQRFAEGWGLLRGVPQREHRGSRRFLCGDCVIAFFVYRVLTQIYQEDYVDFY
jgi:hypothetical protein